MMESLSVRVRPRLQEIARLRAQQMEVLASGDNEGAAVLKKEIFLNFAVLNWVLLLESARNLTAAEAHTLDELKANFRRERQEAGATAEDFNQMAVPPIPRKRNLPLEPFNYLGLPQWVSISAYSIIINH